MPELQAFLKAQRGSVLVGILGLCLVMTIAGAGLMTLVGNVQSDEARALDYYRRFHGAESGLFLGAEWLRLNDSLKIVNSLDPELDLTGGYIDMENASVWIRILENPGIRTVTSKATTGAGSDTLQLDWTVDSLIRDPDDLKNQSILTLQNWTLTNHPFRSP